MDTNQFYDLDLTAIRKCRSMEELARYGHLFNEGLYSRPVEPNGMGLSDSIFGFLYRFIGEGTVNLLQGDVELLIYYKEFAGNRIIVEHVEEV